MILQSTAADVVAIGLATGEIVLFNLKTDEVIEKFLQEWGPVTSIAFRLGNNFIIIDIEI